MFKARQRKDNSFRKQDGTGSHLEFQTRSNQAYRGPLRILSYIQGGIRIPTIHRMGAWTIVILILKGKVAPRRDGIHGNSPREWHFQTLNLSANGQGLPTIMQNRSLPGSLLNRGINYMSARQSERKLKLANNLIC